jgi:hypothetical protein
MRTLADVARAFVHCFQKALQTFAKDGVTLRATEAAGFFEISLGEAAVGAFRFAGGAAGLLHFLRGAEAQKQISEREPCGIIDSFRFGTTFAKIHLFCFSFDHLGQVNRCHVLFTNVAEHFDRFYIGSAPPQVKETLFAASGFKSPNARGLFTEKLHRQRGAKIGAITKTAEVRLLRLWSQRI